MCKKMLNKNKIVKYFPAHFRARPSTIDAHNTKSKRARAVSKDTKRPQRMLVRGPHARRRVLISGTPRSWLQS